MKLINKLNIAAKLTFALWTLYSLYMLFSGNAGITFMQWFGVWLFGCVFFVSVVQIVSSKINKGAKSQKELLRWQKIVTPSAPDKLFATTKQLNEASKMYVEGNVRILNDSLNLITQTETPDVYFKRLNMALERYNNLADIEEFYSTGIKPLESLSAFEDQCPALTQEFIKRYWQRTLDGTKKLKTAKAKENRLQKAKDALMKYEAEMDVQSLNYFLGLYDQEMDILHYE